MPELLVPEPLLLEQAEGWQDLLCKVARCMAFCEILMDFELEASKVSFWEFEWATCRSLKLQEGDEKPVDR